MVVVVVLLGDLAVDDTIEHSLLLEQVLSATMCVIQWREKKKENCWPITKTVRVVKSGWLIRAIMHFVHLRIDKAA